MTYFKIPIRNPHETEENHTKKPVSRQFPQSGSILGIIFRQVRGVNHELTALPEEYEMGENTHQKKSLLICTLHKTERPGRGLCTPASYSGDPSSNLDPESLSRHFSWFSSAPRGKCRDNTLHYATTASFHILSKTFFNHPIIPRH
jgi:hypothetical protein